MEDTEMGKTVCDDHGDTLAYDGTCVLCLREDVDDLPTAAGIAVGIEQTSRGEFATTEDLEEAVTWDTSDSQPKSSK